VVGDSFECIQRGRAKKLEEVAVVPYYYYYYYYF